MHLYAETMRSSFRMVVINHRVLPWGEGSDSAAVAEDAVAWLLLMLFFSFIHGYSVGRDAACSGLEPFRARLQRGWTLGFKPGMVCSKGGGGISVEPLIDGL